MECKVCSTIGEIVNVMKFLSGNLKGNKYFWRKMAQDNIKTNT